MPIYEYRCSKCHHQFEIIQGVADRDAKLTCPKCGAGNPSRMMSAFSCGGPKLGESGASSSCAPRPGSRFS
ncbi:MAG: zinc ribbon domain-containing protein [Syntrophaceae bacterium]|jgi:putative FmdB family regulatory protein|nr:zinc ribbon domain-containing protein [Syntrophaceae bacterium]